MLTRFSPALILRNHYVTRLAEDDIPSETQHRYVGVAHIAILDVFGGRVCRYHNISLMMELLSTR